MRRPGSSGHPRPRGRKLGGKRSQSGRSTRSRPRRPLPRPPKRSQGGLAAHSSLRRPRPLPPRRKSDGIRSRGGLVTLNQFLRLRLRPRRKFLITIRASSC